MRPSRNLKNSGRSRSKQQSCPQYLRSTWLSVHSDNEDLTLKDKATFLATMDSRKTVPWAYTQRIKGFRSTKFTAKESHRTGRKSYKTTSTPVLRSFGDTDDTEDEKFSHRYSMAPFSRCLCECLFSQATSMGSLTSSYSSLGELSASPLEDLKTTSLKAILDPDFCGEFDYDHDPLMRETIEAIVSPKPKKMSRSVSLQTVSASDLAAVDPSILVALPGGRIENEKASPVEKYSPTNLCDMSHILSSSTVSMADIADPRLDLALLRVGSLPVADKSVDPVARKGWDIPGSPEPEKDQPLVPQTRIAYRKLSEARTSESEEDCYPFHNHMLSPIYNLGSSLSTTSRSRSSSLSSTRDSSDYLADISGEEMPTRRITVWQASMKLNLDFERDGAPFVLSPRIPGIANYGALTTNNGLESPGHISRGLEAFFNSRSIVHRLGPHGLEKVYDMEYCHEKCGFAYPVPARRQEVVTRL